MKPIVALWALALTIVGACLFWRNRKRYKKKPWFWIAGKSALEMVILFFTAALMPALLIVWLVCWITRPIKNPWIKTVVGILAGMSFGFLSSFALEALIFFGLFAIEGKTGSQDGGFLSCYKRAENERKPHLVAA